MQISTSLFYDRSTKQFSALSSQADTLQTQISTGKKLLAPSDDVVGYQRLQGIARARGDDGAYAANIAAAQSLLTQTDSTLSDIQTQIGHAQELAIQANSGTLSSTDRGAIAMQLRSILDDLVGLANSKDNRGGPLFGAATGDSAVTRAPDGSVSFTGTGSPAGIPIGAGETVQPTETAERVFGNVATAGGSSDAFAIIAGLADALDTGDGLDQAGAAALDGLKAAYDQVTGVRASVGARGARLDLEGARLTEAATAREADRSAIEDVDVTQAITDLQKTMTILQATQASFTRLSSLSLFDYLK